MGETAAETAATLKQLQTSLDLLHGVVAGVDSRTQQMRTQMDLQAAAITDNTVKHEDTAKILHALMVRLRIPDPDPGDPAHHGEEEEEEAELGPELDPAVRGKAKQSHGWFGDTPGASSSAATAVPTGGVGGGVGAGGGRPGSPSEEGFLDGGGGGGRGGAGGGRTTTLGQEHGGRNHMPKMSIPRFSGEHPRVHVARRDGEALMAVRARSDSLIKKRKKPFASRSHSTPHRPLRLCRRHCSSSSSAPHRRSSPSAAAMVSWGDGEESSTDLSSDGSSALNTIYDSDFTGLDDAPAPTRCKHGAVAGKYVAFEGSCTGRRFLGCAVQEGDKCDYVKWVDPEWPEPMQKAIGQLWDMYGDVKRGRVSDALDFMEKRFKFFDEKEKLHNVLRNAQDELKIVVKEKQVILALKAKAEQALIDARGELEQKKITEACHSNMHKVMRIQAQKDRDKLKEEKRKLEFMIADLLRQKEETRGKIRKISELCEE